MPFVIDALLVEVEEHTHFFSFRSFTIFGIFFKVYEGLPSQMPVYFQECTQNTFILPVMRSYDLSSITIFENSGAIYLLSWKAGTVKPQPPQNSILMYFSSYISLTYLIIHMHQSLDCCIMLIVTNIK